MGQHVVQRSGRPGVDPEHQVHRLLDRDARGARVPHDAPEQQPALGDLAGDQLGDDLGGAVAGRETGELRNGQRQWLHVA
jgi:hypothetical protein